MIQPRLFDTQIFPPDVCIARHRGSPESIAANPSREAKRESHERILAIYRTGDWTAKEISQKLGIPFNAISGRVSELHRVLGKLRPTGIRRDKSAVLTLVR